jgi:hypothetical protein
MLEKDDFYSEENVLELVENDSISIIESGFMMGYLSA